ncbi:MAG: B12-binding domain-containing radical SAM protein, partial [Dehalococcoidia bacterium]
EDFFEPQMDFVFQGEGVTAFRSILRGLEDGRTAPSAPGVWTRQESEFVFGGPPPPFEVDALPVPDRSLSPADRPHYFINWMRPLALARTSVGCPYSCNFCSLWKIMEHIYHMRDIPSVVEELATIDEEFIMLVDDEAFINGKRMVKLAEAIKASGIRHRYFTYCRIDTLIRQPEVLTLWREIGLERLFIGVEAVTDEDLLAFNKKLNVNQVDTGLRLARELGINVFANFIVKPTYTEKDFRQLAKFIQMREDVIDYPSFTIWTPIPGTDLLDSTFSGVIERQPNGRPNWALFDCQNAVTRMALPKGEFIRQYFNLWQLFGSHANAANSPERTAGAFGAHARGPVPVPTL